MVMRALFAPFLVFIALAAASAADLKVKVIDPQSAAVAGAQVILLSKGVLLRTATASAEGFATFGGLNSAELSSGSYQIQILAPGFAQQASDISARDHIITIQFHVAAASELVFSPPPRTPVPTHKPT